MEMSENPVGLLAVRELTISNTHELAALIAVLERKGLVTRREVMEEIERQQTAL